MMSELMLWGAAFVFVIVSITALSAAWARSKQRRGHRDGTRRTRAGNKGIIIRGLAAELNAHAISDSPHDGIDGGETRTAGQRQRSSLIISLPLCDASSPAMHGIAIPTKKYSLDIAA